MSLRRVPLAIGVLALGAAVALTLGVGPALPESSGSVAFVALVIVGGLAAALAMLARSADGPRTNPLPEPGVGGDGRVPGAAVDRQLDSIASREATRAAVEERVERIAVATIAHTEGCSPETARRRLAAGTWTDDERAAAFLASDPSAPPLGERLRALAAGETTARRRATRAIDEIYRLAEDG